MSHNHYPQRKSLRLQGYDYSQEGAYFITICTHRMIHLFGRISNGVMSQSRAGAIAMACWLAIPDHLAGVTLDASVVMPNHIHGIIILAGGTTSLSTSIGAYKAAVSRQIHRECSTVPTTIWHRSYHDRIIRNEYALQQIRNYILDNPARWQVQ